MPFLTSAESRFLTAASSLAYCNPFLPERFDFERRALGREFQAGEPVWSVDVRDPDAPIPNVERLQQRIDPVLETVRQKLRKPLAAPAENDLRVYEESVQLFLYQRYHPQFRTVRAKAPFYLNFAADAHRYLAIPGLTFDTLNQLPHLFACFHQIHRAFHAVFDRIIGSSLPAARLRASVWQSVFTWDMRRYRRVLWNRMGDFATLITGPSGTGKELVARAISASRYLPFDPARLEFADALEDGSFFPVNLAALSPTLIESELFGHRRGAFTGALSDRKGWLETCPVTGSVFLDEIGELDLSLQVKLLRVIESRRFSAVGDTTLRVFPGKLVAATNRALPGEIRAGRFREDLYYRLCADLIRTPSLKEQLDDSPAILDHLVLYMLRRAVGPDAEDCLNEVRDWIGGNLPANYNWPGNYRELEQCVRNVVIRKSYVPVAQQDTHNAGSTEEDLLRSGKLTAEEALSWYATLVYRQTGSYEAAARRLGMDRRTVKAKVRTSPSIPG